jgi:hypothetical protein
METMKLPAVSTAAASCDDSSWRVLELPGFCADMRNLVKMTSSGSLISAPAGIGQMGEVTRIGFRDQGSHARLNCDGLRWIKKPRTPAP